MEMRSIYKVDMVKLVVFRDFFLDFHDFVATKRKGAYRIDMKSFVFPTLDGAVQFSTIFRSIK